MTQKDYSFFKDIIENLVEKKDLSPNLLGTDIEEKYKDFKFSLKNLLDRYGLIDAENQIIIGHNCLKCKHYITPNETCSEKTEKVNVDALFNSLWRRYFPKILLSKFATIAAPFLITQSAFLIANPQGRKVLREGMEGVKNSHWKAFKEHCKCILLNTAEISLRNLTHQNRNQESKL